MGWNKGEFEVVGIPFNERGVGTDDSLRAVKALWASETPSYEGRFVKFRDVIFRPGPYQRPHPPIYGGFAASGRTIDFWAEEGGKLIVLSDNLDFCEKLNERYIATAARHGRQVTPEDASAWGGFLMLTDDKARAEYLMKEHMWFWDEWFIPHGQRMPNVLIGSADEIAEQIGRAHDRLGFDELFLMFGQGHLEPEANQEELEKFIAKVAPRFSSRNAAGVFV